LGRLWRSLGSLGFCYTLAATVSMVGAVGASSYLSLLRQREAWLADLRERSAPIMRHARSLARAVASGQRRTALRELERWAAGLPVVSCVAYGLDGRPLCWLPEGLAPPTLTQANLSRLASSQEPVASVVKRPGRPVYLVGLPVRVGGEVVGAVRLAYSLDEVLLREGAAWRHAVGMTAGVALVGVLLAYLLKGLALGPLRRLSAEMRRVAGGELDRQIREPGDPEVAEAVRAFNQMAVALAQARRELERYNESLEAEIAAARRELERAQAQLIRNARLATAGQLAAGLAHELNNPLTGILMLTSCLQDQARGAEIRQELEEIERMTRRCRVIVGKLLALATDAPLRRERFALGAVVEKALERARRESGAARAVRRCLRAGGCEVLGDADLLEEALVAVVANALQATEDGGTVAVTSQESSEGVEVVVVDTGRGMSPGEVERALDPFFTTRDAGEGMGLGLSIAHSVVRRHGGEMTVESDVGRGTTVRMVLPVASSGLARGLSAS